ncbi:MAG: hypothetical protein ACXVB1_11730 [Pseudobdellovibrionaceae bacterium]
MNAPELMTVFPTPAPNTVIALLTIDILEGQVQFPDGTLTVSPFNALAMALLTSVLEQEAAVNVAALTLEIPKKQIAKQMMAILNFNVLRRDFIFPLNS